MAKKKLKILEVKEITEGGKHAIVIGETEDGTKIQVRKELKNVPKELWPKKLQNTRPETPQD